MTGIVDPYLSQIEHEIRAFCLKKFNIQVHYPTTKIFAQKVLNMGWKNEVSQTDNFYSWLVYTINMYSNILKL